MNKNNNRIRDLREKFFQVDDEYLNGYAKICGINATGVYLSMCRHANKQQTCFPSKKLIAEELAISERSVYTAIKKLEEWNIIKIEQQGRKKDGSFKNLLYTLLDKTQWRKKPSATGAVGKKRHYPSANNDTTRRQQVPNKETHREGNTYKETHTLSAEADGENFSFKEYLQKMKADKRKHIQIIWLFFIIKKRNYTNLKQTSEAIKRNLKAANSLVGYSGKQIKETMEWLNTKFNNGEKRWTLETVGKYIDDIGKEKYPKVSAPKDFKL